MLKDFKIKHNWKKKIIEQPKQIGFYHFTHTQISKPFISQ